MICYNFNHDLKFSLKALPSPNRVLNYSTQERLGKWQQWFIYAWTESVSLISSMWFSRFSTTPLIKDNELKSAPKTMFIATSSDQPHYRLDSLDTIQAEAAVLLFEPHHSLLKVRRHFEERASRASRSQQRTASGHVNVRWLLEKKRDGESGGENMESSHTSYLKSWRKLAIYTVYFSWYFYCPNPKCQINKLFP